MPFVELKTYIKADIKSCFDLSRSIDFHQESLEHSSEKAIAGKTSGLIELDEWVTWEAKHLGVKQQLTSKITKFNSPYYFIDEMVSGPFKSIFHEHIFEEKEGETLMIDRFGFESPFGIIGKFVNWLFLTKYMKTLLEMRNIALKQKLEFRG
ncbi:SRPBCC family protein [Winogradskyella immobilis]|uniref:SRPBCC family protein n=1 Tax=Winogradskyella immobilis TaxID=2816852 RepID=A0ABS8ELQ1_9FLAO|nr:SRPBCC family protein [Winogradskyella immobilis]MCC1484139.1 SRPBCC family protein [Winogradskyella immobilis]MCG0016231.1 SRPBCC family protein [Winogradskyella immobilis]